MNHLYLGMIIGVVIGLIDITPMLIQKMNKHSVVSAFLQYFFISIIIVNIDLPFLPWWIEGAIISLALALPVIIIVTMTDKKAIPIIGSMAIILGTLISILGHYF